jgi:hypothetical protein
MAENQNVQPVSSSADATIEFIPFNPVATNISRPIPNITVPTWQGAPTPNAPSSTYVGR